MEAETVDDVLERSAELVQAGLLTESAVLAHSADALSDLLPLLAERLDSFAASDSFNDYLFYGLKGAEEVMLQPHDATFIQGLRALAWSDLLTVAGVDDQAVVAATVGEMRVAIDDVGTYGADAVTRNGIVASLHELAGLARQASTEEVPSRKRRWAAKAARGATFAGAMVIGTFAAEAGLGVVGPLGEAMYQTGQNIADVVVPVEPGGFVADAADALDDKASEVTGTLIGALSTRLSGLITEPPTPSAAFAEQLRSNGLANAVAYAAESYQDPPVALAELARAELLAFMVMLYARPNHHKADLGIRYGRLAAALFQARSELVNGADDAATQHALRVAQEATQEFLNQLNELIAGDLWPDT